LAYALKSGNARGIPELKKYQDQTCRHLDRRNRTARCSIYGNRLSRCKSYQCLWREGFFNDEDRPDKSGVIAHFSPLDSGRIDLMVFCWNYGWTIYPHCLRNQVKKISNDLDVAKDWDILLSLATQ
jgi:hypothetical protein